MTIRELRNFIRLKKLPDQWWLAVDNEVYEEKVRLIDLEMRQARLKNREVYVLNSDIEFRNREWTKVEFSGLHLYDLDNSPRPIRTRSTPPSVVGSIGDKKQSRRLSEAAAEDLPESEQLKKLAEKERELMALEKELQEREAYVRQSEEALIRRSYLHEVKEAELQQLSDKPEFR